jgi:hypothetical protein
MILRIYENTSRSSRGVAGEIAVDHRHGVPSPEDWETRSDSTLVLSFLELTVIAHRGPHPSDPDRLPPRFDGERRQRHCFSSAVQAQPGSRPERLKPSTTFFRNLETLFSKLWNGNAWLKAIEPVESTAPSLGALK